MNVFFGVIKSIVKALLVWFGLTVIAVMADSALELSEKNSLFAFFFIAVPLLAALWVLVNPLIRRSQSVPKKKQPEKKPKQGSPSPIPETASTAPKAGTMEAAMAYIDQMDGLDFEKLCAEMLERLGYQQVHVTKGSGDQGVDIVALKGGIRYAFQCKRYAHKLGNKAVQEVNAGKEFYHCQVGVVITNNYFTAGAEDAAKAVGVELWDRDILIRKLDRVR